VTPLYVAGNMAQTAAVFQVEARSGTALIVDAWGETTVGILHGQTAGFTSVVVTGLIYAEGGLSGSPVTIANIAATGVAGPTTYLRGDGAWAVPVGGSDTQIQFNDGGVLGGDAGLVWDKALDTMSFGTLGDVDAIRFTNTGARLRLGAGIGSSAHLSADANDYIVTPTLIVSGGFQTVGAVIAGSLLGPLTGNASTATALSTAGLPGEFWSANNTWAVPGVVAAGSDTQVIFNNGGVLSGRPSLTFDLTSKTLKLLDTLIGAPAISINPGARIDWGYAPIICSLSGSETYGIQADSKMLVNGPLTVFGDLNCGHDLMSTVLTHRAVSGWAGVLSVYRGGSLAWSLEAETSAPYGPKFTAAVTAPGFVGNLVGNATMSGSVTSYTPVMTASCVHIVAAIDPGNTSATVTAPTNGSTGQKLTLILKAASSGGPWTVTLNAIYKLNSAFGTITPAASRVVEFIYDGTSWLETYRSADLL
jgi:hypothetical protein